MCFLANVAFLLVSLLGCVFACSCAFLPTYVLSCLLATCKICFPPRCFVPEQLMYCFLKNQDLTIKFIWIWNECDFISFVYSLITSTLRVICKQGRTSGRCRGLGV